jgi:hypothetical protein
MKIFLFIYLTVLLAFNEAFTRIDESFDASNEENKDASNFNGKNWA